MKQPSARVVLAVLALAIAPAAVYAGCVFAPADDCELSRGWGCGSTSGSTGGKGGAGGHTTGSTSTGGSGIGCDPSACPAAPPGLCAFRGKPVCADGGCAIEYEAGPAKSYEVGSCKKKMCGADGGAYDEPDPTNVYDNGNPCIHWSCSDAGVLEQVQANTGETCERGDAGSGFCELDPYIPGLIVCAVCDPNGTSVCSAACAKGVCVPAACKNGVKDPNETDVDCGGGASGCLLCAKDKTCISSPDCASGVCANGKCLAPSCPDNVKNQDETDVDCGGSACPTCADGRRCLVADDCTSRVCLQNLCVVPSCVDGVKNGDETGIDCGGTTSKCPPCASP